MKNTRIVLHQRQIRPAYITISGSRSITDIDCLVREFLRILQPNMVYVGDAFGVDEIVQRSCVDLGIQSNVFGVALKPRNNAPKSVYFSVGKTYTERDKYMVDRSRHFVGFWDGKSRGTLAVYMYAKQFIPSKLLLVSNRNLIDVSEDF